MWSRILANILFIWAAGSPVHCETSIEPWDYNSTLSESPLVWTVSAEELQALLLLDDYQLHQYTLWKGTYFSVVIPYNCGMNTFIHIVGPSEL